MNFLAHAYLSGDCLELLLGNLLGDFVKGAALDGYPAGIRRGIVLHRKIDAYTDSHPVVADSRRRLSAPLRRCGGIIVDILYDHYLAARWRAYSPVPLSEFTHGVYRALLASQDLLPGRLRAIVPRMAAEDWLAAYADPERVRASLRRVGARLTRPLPLDHAVDDLLARYDAFGGDFDRFFPDLIAHAAAFR